MRLLRKSSKAREVSLSGIGASPVSQPDPAHPLPRVKRVELDDGSIVYTEVPSVAPPQRTATATRGGPRDPDKPKQVGYPPWEADLFGWRF